jgi:hypothetical protein
MKKFAHGDVIIVQVENFETKDTAQDEQCKNGILAYGEVTGHKHQLQEKENFSLFKVTNLNETLLLNVIKDVILKHEEHNKITIPPGKYKVYRIREADHIMQLVRTVAD